MMIQVIQTATHPTFVALTCRADSLRAELQAAASGPALGIGKLRAFSCWNLWWLVVTWGSMGSLILNHFDILRTKIKKVSNHIMIDFGTSLFVKQTRSTNPWPSWASQHWASAPVKHTTCRSWDILRDLRLCRLKCRAKHVPKKLGNLEQAEHCCKQTWFLKFLEYVPEACFNSLGEFRMSACHNASHVHAGLSAGLSGFGFLWKLVRNPSRIFQESRTGVMFPRPSSFAPFLKSLSGLS